MVSSISMTATNGIQLMMAQIHQKIGAADTDGTNGLSKDELSSIDFSGDVGGSAFLQSLSDQFDELDTDANGELSASEMSAAKSIIGGPMGPPPGMNISFSGETNSADLTGSVAKSDEIAAADSKESGTSAKEMIEELLAKLMQSFADSYSTSANADKQEEANAATQAIKDLTTIADSDGKIGLSKDELSAVNINDNKGMAKLVNDMISKFNSLDKNGDGQLSMSEMKEILPGKEFSQQELAAMAHSNSSNSSDSKFGDFVDSFGDLTSNFVQKLINSYKDGGLSKIASSIGAVV